MSGDVQTWSLTRVTGSDPRGQYNANARALESDPNAGDSMTVELSKVGSPSPIVWHINSWFGTAEQAERIQREVLDPIGNHNNGASANCASYRTDEVEESEGSPDAENGTATTAPFGGWNLERVLADLVRKRDQLEFVA